MQVSQPLSKRSRDGPQMGRDGSRVAQALPVCHGVTKNEIETRSATNIEGL